MIPLTALLLAAAVDGEAVLRHASALASLGPHAFGSPRIEFAAEYVAAQFRIAGLDGVNRQEFSAHGVRGFNVTGVLRSASREFVVVGAHHDSAPGAPGAYDDGAGVGVLIEVARTLLREGDRQRTIVFASFDGEEDLEGLGTPGSRAYLASLGAEARNLVAAFDLEMCGWKDGTLVFHPIPHVDPLRPRASVVTPAWLMQAVLDGAREAGAPMRVGDPYISWLYQPAVRTFRVALYGDDLPFLQGGRAAVFASDSSFSAFYPHYHQPTDTPDKLDARSLARVGQVVAGIVRALERVRPGPPSQPHWFVAFGRVIGYPTLLVVGALSLVPGLIRARSAGGAGFGLRLLQAALFALLMWRHPVPALFILLLPHLLGTGRGLLRLLSLLPAAALAGLGVAAKARGMVAGPWMQPWELVVLGLALLLALFAAPPRRTGTRRRRR